MGTRPALLAQEVVRPHARLSRSVLNAWRINSRVTAFLVERLPAELWPLGLPGAPRRTVRSVAVHLHNCRCLWLNSLAQAPGIAGPRCVNRATASLAEVLAALARSADAVERLLRAGLENGGPFPGVKSPFIYGAMPRDAVLFCGYALSHEAHHRGQLVVAARALGHRLPPVAINGLWQWSSRLREATAIPLPASDRGGRRSRPPRR